MSELPKGWAAARLIDVTSIKTGKLDANAANIDGQYPFFTCAEEISRINTYSFDTNAVLLAGNGFFNVKRFKGKFDAYQRTYVIEPLEIDVDFLYQVFQYLLPVIASKSRGSTIKYLRIGDIQNIEFKLPPAAEQTRIVAKLEELLSGLEAGVAELKAAQKKLVQYRQSLLKAAVEGTLTKAWRDATPASETGQALLARILKERRVRWEAKQLLKFAAAGKAPPKDWQKKYPEPAKPDTTGLAKLPEGWVWATVEQLAHVGTGVTPLRSKPAYFEGGTTPWVTSGALNDEFVTTANETVSELALKECRLEVYPVGSLLVAMYGEGKTRGKCSELMIPATINQAIAALVLESEAQNCKAYLKAFLLNSYEKMREQASGGVQPNLNLLIVKSIVLPLPPVAEQNEMTRQLSSFFEQIDAQQIAVEHSLKQSAAQRKNILQAAFAGRLVAQDPKDEPASVLLARIAKERSKAIQAKKKMKVEIKA